jgi:hypothetical protein
LKKSIKAYNLRESIDAIIFLFKNEEKFFNKFIYHEVINVPINFKTKHEDVTFVVKVITETKKYLERLSNEGDVNESFYFTFKKESTEFLMMLTTLYRLYKENEAILNMNKFMEFPFKKQIQMWCTFIESQYIYSKREVKKTINNNGYISGMEMQISEEGTPNSLKDNLEAFLEIFNPE